MNQQEITLELRNDLRLMTEDRDRYRSFVAANKDEICQGCLYYGTDDAPCSDDCPVVSALAAEQRNPLVTPEAPSLGHD